MNKDLTSLISNCDICASSLSAQPKEPLISHPIPSGPWEKIGTDIFTHNNKDYLCTVDYYSDYFEVDQLSSKNGEVIIKKLKKHFATHGIPDVLQMAHPSLRKSFPHLQQNMNSSTPPVLPSTPKVMAKWKMQSKRPKPY